MHSPTAKPGRIEDPDSSVAMVAMCVAAIYGGAAGCVLGYILRGLLG